MKDSTVTTEDVHQASEKFLKALDAAPTGAGTILKDQLSKDWMETSVLRAFSKLQSAEYHCANVERLVKSAHESAEGQAGEINAHATNAGTIRISGQFGVQEIAYEIDAFLAASRACIDFITSVLALHVGMNRRASVTKLIDFVKKKPNGPFECLTEWIPWIEALKNYRDECVHYRALRTQTGYEAVRRKGVTTIAVLPFVIPEKIPAKDFPDTRQGRFYDMGGFQDDVSRGLVKVESSGSITTDDGTELLLEHSIGYEPATGYIRVEKFCARHLGMLRQLMAEVLEQALSAKFSYQQH